jgi:hypothetical protein
MHAWRRNAIASKRLRLSAEEMLKYIMGNERGLRLQFEMM